MNKQQKLNRDGTIKSKGIEWCDFTWNPVTGCFHACQWAMPDGTIANCYAEDVAERLATAAYLLGFEHHYWKPDTFRELKQAKEPSRIFVGSMADVFGHWVNAGEINVILNAIANYPEHTFIFLTKNPRRILQFEFPPNCWLLASTPPDFMWNKKLPGLTKLKMLGIALDTFGQMDERQIVGLSAEPLSWNIVPLLYSRPSVLNWVIIGAASSGKTYYPPEERNVRALVEYCDEFHIPVFFKGNLRSLPWAVANWRQAFPIASALSAPVESVQLSLW